MVEVMLCSSWSRKFLKRDIDKTKDECRLELILEHQARSNWKHPAKYGKGIPILGTRSPSELDPASERKSRQNGQSSHPSRGMSKSRSRPRPKWGKLHTKSRKDVITDQFGEISDDSRWAKSLRFRTASGESQMSHRDLKCKDNENRELDALCLVIYW